MITQQKILTTECPCGTISFPDGKDIAVSFLRKDQELATSNLLHEGPVELKSKQVLNTVSDFINSVSDFDFISLSRTDGNPFTVDHVIQLRVIQYPINIPIYVNLLGDFGYTTSLTNIQIPIPDLVKINNVIKSAFIFEFTSMCDFGKDFDPCCDSLPDSLPIDGYLKICIPLSRYYSDNVINPVTTTTIPPEFKGKPC